MLTEQYLVDVKLKREDVPSFNEYPFRLDAVRDLSSLRLHPSVTFLIGENGSGKSTLLEAIAVAWGFNPEGGSRNFGFSTYDDDPEGGGGRLITAYGGRSLHGQSHGESFMALLMHRFRGDGLYLLDEPEAALSPNRQMAMLARLHQLVKKRSQFVIATHSPIIMAYPDARIYQLGSDGPVPVAYEDTEHYQVTKDFLERREMMLRILLEDED